MRRADWWNRWGLDQPLSLGHQTVHLNLMARVDAVHGPSLRSALSIIACVPVPTRRTAPVRCMHALDVALLRHPYRRSKLSHAYH